MCHTPLPRLDSHIPSVFWSQFPYLQEALVLGLWPLLPGVPKGLVALMLHLSSNSLRVALEGSWLGKPVRSVGQPPAYPGSGLLVILSLSVLPVAPGIATLPFFLSKRTACWEGGMSRRAYPELSSTSC